VEEGSVGGFATQVLHYLATEGMLDHGLKIRPMVLPDCFLEQDSPEKQYEIAGLKATNIVATALSALGRDAQAVLEPKRA
jgi:1-deoxy-D-xylulose-5-phosphate synthase